jgi:hypothetical protein
MLHLQPLCRTTLPLIRQPRTGQSQLRDDRAGAALTSGPRPAFRADPANLPVSLQWTRSAHVRRGRGG